MCHVRILSHFYIAVGVLARKDAFCCDFTLCTVTLPLVGPCRLTEFTLAGPLTRVKSGTTKFSKFLLK